MLFVPLNFEVAENLKPITEASSVYHTYENSLIASF